MSRQPTVALPRPAKGLLPSGRGGMAAIYDRKAAEHRRIAELKSAERLAEVTGGAGEEDDRRA